MSFFSIVRARFSAILNTFRNLLYDELVPCICTECKRSPSPYYFRYRTLLRCKSKRRSFLPCEKSILDVDVIELLRGVEMHVEEIKWQVFISYSSKDFTAIEMLINELKKKRISYWLDREHIKPGESITQNITKGLDNSDNILLCVSDNQLESGWSRAEYSQLLHEILGKNSEKKIIPLIIDDFDITKLPALLKDYRYIRLSEPKDIEDLFNSLA